MKTKLLSIIAILLGTVMTLPLAACHDEVKPGPEAGATGEVNLMSMAVEISNAENVIVSSRASIDLSGFIVEIFNAEGARVQKYAYGDMPGVVTLTAGDYTVKVRSHEVQKAEWDKPYFTGEKAFTVTAGALTDVGIVSCKLSNIRVSIRFTDELRKYMGDDCQVTVIANDQGRLVFTPDETRSGYFEALAGSSTLVAEFSGTVGGNKELLRHICRDVEAGQHRIITFKVKGGGGDKPGEVGGIDPGDIRIDTEVTNVNLTTNINTGEDNLGDEDRPGGDDGGGEDPGPGPGPDDPDINDITMTCEGASFEQNNVLTSEDAEKEFHVVATITAPQGINNLLVSISTDNKGFEDSVSELMPMTFDLAYPGEYGDAFSSIGFPVGNEVIGNTSVPFDISQFIPLRAGFEGTHHFQISVIDSKKHQLVKTLTFVVTK